MSTRNLEKIFAPKRIAVVGASDDPGSVGQTVLRNLIGSGFAGVVYPVNLKRESVMGIAAYPSLKEIPKQVDLAVIATPAQTVPDLIEECGQAGILGVIVISAGFKEIGEEGRLLEEEILKRARPYGVRIIGPNCLGVIAPRMRLNASFAASMPQPGNLALISQSGALCTAILDWSAREGVGFSYFVSIGDMVDVDFGDLIDYFGADPQTRAIILYIESLTNVRKFMSAARAFARTKPIVVVKSGRFPEAAKAAASHTGALAGEDLVYDAAFQRAGIVRVEEIEDLFDCAEIVAKQRNPKGPRLAIITNAGGPGVMATDGLLTYRGKLAELSPETMERLNGVLPPFWSHGNPVDILGDAPPERYAKALEVVLQDKAVDGVLVVLTPQAMTDPTGVARQVIQVAKESTKPVLAAWMGGESVAEGIELLNKMGVPTYSTPEQAAKTFSYMYSYTRNLELLYETPKDIRVDFALDRKRVKEIFDLIMMEGRELLSETISKSLLETYGIPVAKPYPARTPEEAIALAERIGYPVVLKLLSPQISHKSDVGGVLLDLHSAEAVRKGFQEIVDRARRAEPKAQIEGVTVQKMIRAENGYEVILGAKKDPTFGAVILFGMGGIAAEVFQDRAVGLPPLNERLAQRLIESTRSYRVLKGFRGRPPVNLDLLKEILIRFSYLVVDYPEIEEMDINPLLISPEGAWALDARVLIDKEALAYGVKPYSHLAIRPYPEELVQRTKTKDGAPLTLRPIKPEDEPLWHKMLATFSEETIRFRFFYHIGEITHEFATRYCFIDYEREVAIVAELEEGGERKLIGVGRLTSEPNQEEAELAVVVGDPWQGRGVGTLLTDYCLEIARRRGVKRVFAEMLPDNERIIAMLRRRGFQMELAEDVVKGVKALED
ncbi:MAG: bifunctional acetate--CoA ligase family protein/GNAT family N-acetyltransferase [Candidatus Acetothermia bacterium]|jgi:acetyltransferase|nr:bifunctional acetate--CoA ligase family protein/GNAT family N-acetyltransferase [Candidatus Acetothermia bacterium]MDH7505443.1 bifunctional acetate--CoA ligase family protein/GNAT family N-acetyltransferase [Candidatus Acetothermia bacterium]